MDDGFYLIYAKRCGIPQNIFFETRIEVVNFFIKNLNDIDFISINDVIIDKNKLINDNIKLSRYLKLKKIKENYEL
jgi:ABC-type proline/glycine betaine transport system ATPase subunit